MSDMLNTKVGEFTLVDGLVITASKLATEAVLSKVSFVGNSTYKSGLIKVAGAVAISMLSKNKYAQYVATGVMLDGIEDIAVNAKSQFLGGSNVNNGEVIM